MSAIFLIGAAFACFFALLLESKKPKHLPDQILAAWFLVLMLHLLLYDLIYEKAYLDYPHLLGLPNTIPFLYGPLFFCYVDTLTSEHPRFRRSYYLHFIPFLLANFEYSAFYFAEATEKIDMYFRNESHLAPWSRMMIMIAKLTSGPAYLTIVWMRLRQHNKNIRQYFSRLEDVDLRWLRTIVAVYATFLVLVFLLLILDQKVFDDSDPVIFALVTAFVISLGYGGFRQGMIFGDVRTYTQKPINEADRIARYERSNLTDEDARRYSAILLTWMETEKPFLDPELTIETVSSRLNIARHKLTQVINQHLGKNFYQFVNEFRVREFKQRILDPANGSLTMLAVAMECGFNSKSSFNTVFKNVTGMTPSEFKKVKPAEAVA